MLISERETSNKAFPRRSVGTRGEVFLSDYYAISFTKPVTPIAIGGLLTFLLRIACPWFGEVWQSSFGINPQFEIEWGLARQARRFAILRSGFGLSTKFLAF
ncbi:hypothetical protein JW964_21320 [candidate division KSB1 bacterium]|nr:hypothetical protein [candidate division KSB1 bacterium]